LSHRRANISAALFFPTARDVWREVRMSDERAGFLEEESEERIEPDFLAGEI
jgi:hypothetical protein